MDRDVVGAQGDLRGEFKGDMFWSKIVVLFFAAKKKKRKKKLFSIQITSFTALHLDYHNV